MLHLIAAGWDKLEDHDQPEVASFAKGIINAMTPKQIRRQAPVHGTCVHACAEAGAGAFFRFLLEHGGGDCTQVRCAPDPEPANKPAKTAMERFRKMFFAAAPGGSRERRNRTRRRRWRRRGRRSTDWRRRRPA